MPSNIELGVPALSPTVLVVENDPFARLLLSTLLSSKYAVEIAESGNDALMVVNSIKPDLILMGGDMPGLSEHDTCRKIRQRSEAPVIFVSGDQDIDAALSALDSGGHDYVPKAFDTRFLARKIDLAIEGEIKRKLLLAERIQEQAMARTLASTIGESGILLNFMRELLRCEDFHSLTNKITEAIAAFGLYSCVQVRHEFLTLTLTTQGEATPLELSVVEHVLGMGRVFQFKKRMAVNYDNVTIVILNMPDNEEQCGRIRDNLVILCESAQALVEEIGRRFNALHEKEDIMGDSAKAHDCLLELKDLQRGYQSSIQMLLHDFINQVESEYRSMDLLLEQEQRISALMGKIVGKMFDVFHENGQEFTRKSDEILGILIPDRSDAVELF
jgi:CheY-like chemotaxis protein